MGYDPASGFRVVTGRLVKLNRGVFRLAAYPSKGPCFGYAALLATVGEGSYLCGESVFQLYDLCPTRSYVATVATPRHVRRTTIPKCMRLAETVGTPRLGDRPVMLRDNCILMKNFALFLSVLII